ncbi:Glycolate dehydrogenase, iron-sulfur subunit GlcF, partial [hydrothermal vent metagenome]
TPIKIPSMNSLSATERCVKCGLCLPHCPTFVLTGNEADSPRGRISLMQALQQTDRDLSPGLFRHLDQCLQCGACEAMCPSQVPFEALMDTARAQLEPLRRRSLLKRLSRRLGFQLITSKRGQRLTAAGLAGVQTLGLDRLLATLPGLPKPLCRSLRLLPAAQPKSFQRTTAENPPTGTEQRLQFFTGCSGDLFDRTTLNATQRLLQRLGYAVDIPAGQTCCGALHQHNGEPGKAAQLARANLGTFSSSEPVITVASGCQARLQSYVDPAAEADGFRHQVIDILSFLLARGNADLEFKPINTVLALQIPCTQRNALRQAGTGEQILAWIPGLKLLTLNPNGGCCGAAGNYMLSQPQLSEPLGRQMADTFIASGAQQLVTTNIGCALQLRAALGEQGRRVEVVHPVTLLERTLIGHMPVTGRR